MVLNLRTGIGGKTHDFRLFKESGVSIHQECEVLADSGYQGLDKRHAHTLLPKKRSKKRPLTSADKKNNAQIASRRVVVEHVIGALKRFHILAERYRNRRKRFGLRINLIAAWYNFHLLHQ